MLKQREHPWDGYDWSSSVGGPRKVSPWNYPWNYPPLFPSTYVCPGVCLKEILLYILLFDPSAPSLPFCSLLFARSDFNHDSVGKLLVSIFAASGKVLEKKAPIFFFVSDLTSPGQLSSSAYPLSYWLLGQTIPSPPATFRPSTLLSLPVFYPGYPLFCFPDEFC